MIQRLLLSALALFFIAANLVSAEPLKRHIAPTPMMSAEARLLVSLLEQAHFASMPLKAIDLPELLPNFMSDLDYHRLFFTEGDRDAIEEKYARNLESDLRIGNIAPAFDIFEIYRRRALDRIDWVLERLDGDFAFDTDKTYRVDRSEMPWPADREEADKIWERRLAYELLVDLLNDKSIEDAKENVNRRYERLRRNILETEADEVQELFLTALGKLYDPHSSFLSASTLEDFSISMQLSLVGIGAQLTSIDGYATIRELIPGGPAALDNQLRSNDRIVAVAQEGEDPVDVIDMKLRRVVEMIRGKKGTTVHLTIIPADAVDSSERQTISLVRDEIRLTASRAQGEIHEVSNENGEVVPIGVISIPSFYGSVGIERPGQTRTSTADDVEKLIKQLKEAGIEGLVIDLRRNGGGLLSEAIRLTGLFIETGPVVRVKDSRGGLRVDPDRNPAVAYSGPLGILVSRNSASASEIVAGALQNYGRAVIMGESSTHGKGTVQAIFELENYLFRGIGNPQPTGAAKMTVQKFYLPDGQSTQNRGVVPDIVFPSFNEYLSIGESDLPNALIWDTISPEDWEEERDRFPIRSPVEREIVADLYERSEKRQEELEEFNYLKENIERFRQKQKEKEFSLDLERRQQQREEDRLFREKMEEAEQQLALKGFASRLFRLDEEPEIPSEILPDEDSEDLSLDLARTEDRLDIHLRESLRVLVDLVELGGCFWGEATVTAQRANAKVGGN